MPEIVKSQRTKEWMQARLGKVSASLAGAILGVDPHRGQFSAWQEISGNKLQADNLAMQWGRQNEDKARREYEAESGNIVQETGLWQHPDFEWLIASPDGLVQANAAVEIKCPAKLPDTIPPHHDCQMRVQLACTGREWVDYFCWTPDGHWLKRIVRDPMIERQLIAKLEAWYNQYVVTNTKPPMRKPKGAMK